MSFAKENKREKTMSSIKLRESQDSRLTSRHIAALMKLDDTTLENEKLKTKVDLLEKEFGSCLELHEFARDAKQKLAGLKEEYESKIKLLVEEQNNHLTEQEESYTIRLEKIKKNCKCEKETLMEQLLEAKYEIDSLQNDKQSMLDEYEGLLLDKSDLQIENTEESSEYKVLENKTKLLENELSLLKKENNELKKDKNGLLSEVKNFRSEILHLKVHGKAIQDKVNDCSPEELDKMSTKLDTMMNESKKYNEELKELRFKEQKRDQTFNDLNKRIELYEMERKVLIETSNDKSIEITHLKEQLKKLQQGRSQSLPNSPKYMLKLRKSSINEDVVKPWERANASSTRKVKSAIKNGKSMS